MVDDHTQRPYRSSDSIARAPAKPAEPARGGGSGSDPLAELARLIGQSDPFSEYGRAQAAPAEAAPDALIASQATPTVPEAPPSLGSQSFNPRSFARQPFGGAPLAADSDLYQVEGNEQAYPAAAQDDAYPAAAPDDGYQDDGYQQTTPHLGAEHGDYYEDVAPSGRRMTILMIAGVFGLAVLGAAGAFGYRAMFGHSGSSAPPPVIKADTAPSKVVPASTRDSQPNKLITERAPSEKLVSREEQPLDIKDKAAAAPPPVADQIGAVVQGSGVVSPDAKKVRTIAIRPDQSGAADAAPPTAAVPPPAKQAAPAAQPPQQLAPSPRVVSNAPPASSEPAPPKRQAVTHAPPVQQQAAAPAANAPLSLNPDAPPRAARAAAPAAHTAAPAGAGGSYVVQLSSQRSEAEAQAAFRSQQGKYPDVLGGKQPLIHKADLGEKGVYYRAMVGPFATSAEANQLCSSLKAAGGQCFVQKN